MKTLYRRMLSNILVLALMMISICSIAITTSSPAAAITPETLPNLNTLQSLIAASVKITLAPQSSSTFPPLSTLSFAQTIWPKTYMGPCYVTTPDKHVPLNPVASCSYGDISAHRSILLTGDSQAGGWLAAFHSFGVANHWRIIFLAMAKCAPWGSGASGSALLYNDVTAANCDAFRVGVQKAARTLHPTVTALAGLSYYSSYAVQVSQELESATKFSKANSKVLFLKPVPQYEPWINSPTPVSCLLIYRSNVSQCLRPPDVLINPTLTHSFNDVASKIKGSVVNTTPLFCTSSACAIYVFDGSKRRMINSDATHINYYYSAWVSKALGEILLPLLPNTPR